MLQVVIINSQFIGEETLYGEKYAILSIEIFLTVYFNESFVFTCIYTYVPSNCCERLS